MTGDQPDPAETEESEVETEGETEEPIEVAFKATDAEVPDDAAVCSNCNEALIADQRFCEACGEDTTPEADGPTCVDCGAPQREIDADGYCSQCGRKQPDGRDHLELDEGHVAGTTNKGKRHHRNEDAFAIVGLPNGGITVVCDGVSSTGEPQKASQAAADAAAEFLAAAVSEGAPDLGEATQEAVAVAQTAVLKATQMVGANEPPSCTIVATTAVANPTTNEVTVTMGWLGDSRGYWVDRTSEGVVVTQLTEDDSWAQVQISAGTMTEEEAMREPQAHSITKWLGADASDTLPRIATHVGSTGGYTMACSDGLWNYAQDSTSMGTKLQELDDRAPLERSQELVNFANDAGGHDNITVAIIEFPEAPVPETVDPETAVPETQASQSSQESEPNNS